MRMTGSKVADTTDFFVPFRPVPKQSARFGKGHAWQPKRIRENSKLIQMISRSAARVARWSVDDGPICLEVHFCFKWPKNTRKTVRDTWEVRTQTPDNDNLMKQLKDSTLGFWRDDRQVSVEYVHRWNAPVEGIACRVQKILDYRDLKYLSLCESMEWISGMSHLLRQP